MTLSWVAQVLLATLALVSGVMMVRAQIRLLTGSDTEGDVGSLVARDPASLVRSLVAMTRQSRTLANEPQPTVSAEQARRAYRGWQLTMICAFAGLILVALFMPR